MQVRAVWPIAAGDAMTVAYVGVMEPRAVRMRELLESKHFVCGCQRCTEPLAQSVDLCLEVRSPSLFETLPLLQHAASPSEAHRHP